MSRDYIKFGHTSRRKNPETERIEIIAMALCDAADWNWPKKNSDREYWRRLASAAIAADPAGKVEP